MSTLAANPGFADGIALEHSVLTKLKTAIDGSFSDAEAAIPKFTGDEVQFGEAWLRTHATGYEASFIDGALALGGNVIQSGIAKANVVAQAELVSLAKTVDLHLTAAGAV